MTQEQRIERLIKNVSVTAASITICLARGFSPNKILTHLSDLDPHIGKIILDACLQTIQNEPKNHDSR